MLLGSTPGEEKGRAGSRIRRGRASGGAVLGVASDGACGDSEDEVRLQSCPECGEAARQAFTSPGQSSFGCGPSPEGTMTLDKVAQFSRANHQRWPTAEGCPQGHCQQLGSESSSKGTSWGHNTASNGLWYL